jgi:hypothetical protein
MHSCAPRCCGGGSYGTIVQTAFGRVYIIYNRNSGNVTTLPDSTQPIRNDELGFFVMRWSDDGGCDIPCQPLPSSLHAHRCHTCTPTPPPAPAPALAQCLPQPTTPCTSASDTWSPTYVDVPYRSTWIDGNNSFHGATNMMWSVDQVKVVGNRTFHAFTKIGAYDQQHPEQSFFLSSPNLLTAPDASDVTWDLFPDGEVGVVAPDGGCMNARLFGCAGLPGGGGRGARGQGGKGARGQGGAAWPPAWCVAARPWRRLAWAWPRTHWHTRHGLSPLHPVPLTLVVHCSEHAVGGSPHRAPALWRLLFRVPDQYGVLGRGKHRGPHGGDRLDHSRWRGPVRGGLVSALGRWRGGPWE